MFRRGQAPFLAETPSICALFMPPSLTLQKSKLYVFFKPWGANPTLQAPPVLAVRLY